MVRSASGGQRRTMVFRRGSAVPAPFAHPTKEDGSARQERHRKLVKQIGGVPWHEMLAAVGEVQIELRVALLQELRAFLGAGAIIAAVDQEQRLLDLDEPLPQRRR